MKLKAILTSSMGNMLEWYDFGLFIYCAPIISNNFFNTNNKSLSILYVYALFAVGFLCRPIGAILFGHLGDKIGRAKTLIISIAMISTATFLVSILPTHQQVGDNASILLIVMRLIQGICIGGEYSGNIIYLGESAEKDQKAFLTSFAATGANIGFFLASFITMILERFLTSDEMSLFGWRIAFVIGAIIGITILYFRRTLKETPYFQKLKDQHRIEKTPLFKSIKKDYWQMIKVICILGYGSTLYYITFTYLNAYIAKISNITSEEVLFYQTFFIALMFFLVPIFGKLCDLIGRRKMYFIFCISSIILAYPIFWLFHQSSIISLICGFLALTIFSSMEQGTTLITVMELVPVSVRYTSFSLAYNIGNLIFGGLTPFALTSLNTLINSTYLPAFYLTGSSILTLFFIILFVKK